MSTMSDDKTEQGAGRRHRSRMRNLRYAMVLGVLAVYLVGAVLNTGLGSLCAFGISDIAAVCPVGILETALAGRVILPLPLIVLLVVIGAAVLVGRAFCGWVCPVPLARKLVTGKGERDAWEDERKRKGRSACSSCKGSSCAGADCGASGKSKPRFVPFSKNSKSALGVLGVTLVTTLIFGFPVFCLVCPVGLVFATIFAVIRLVAFNELVVDIVVFPALIVVELVLLRTWCSSLCPIGAFLGLFARLGTVFRPEVDTSKCLATTQRSSCDACHSACAFDIDLVRDAGSGNIADCSRCGECAAHCPVDAISFRTPGRLWAQKRKDAQDDEVVLAP